MREETGKDDKGYTIYTFTTNAQLWWKDEQAIL